MVETLRNLTFHPLMHMRKLLFSHCSRRGNHSLICPTKDRFRRRLLKEIIINKRNTFMQVPCDSFFYQHSFPAFVPINHLFSYIHQSSITASSMLCTSIYAFFNRGFYD